MANLKQQLKEVKFHYDGNIVSISPQLKNTETEIPNTAESDSKEKVNYICLKCDYITISIHDLKAHIPYNHSRLDQNANEGKRFKCKICGKGFYYKSIAEEFNRHLCKECKNEESNNSDHTFRNKVQGQAKKV